MIEVVLVMGIMAIMATIGFGTTMNYYRTSIIDADLSALVTVLRSTRQRAISNDTSSDYSVKFLVDRYVIFPGTGYNPSNPKNENNFLDSGVIVSTTFTNNELTFQNFTGRGLQGGNVAVRAFDLTKRVYLNQLGIVERVQ